MSRLRKNIRELAGITVLVIGGLILLSVFASHNSTDTKVTHSTEWQEGFNAGSNIYQQTDYMGTLPDHSPTDKPLVDMCVESATGQEPYGLPDYTQWLQGYDAGCYGG